MSLPYDEYIIVFQAYIVLLSLGAVVSDGSQRDRSIITVLFVWSLWVLVTDQLSFDVPDVVLSWEATLFTVFVVWAIVRPYFYVSADLAARREHVLIGFYHGTRAPLLSSVGALMGLPFSSVLVVAGDTILRASGNGKMVINNTSALREDEYTFIDTGVVATPEIFKAISLCVGRPTKVLGLFRTRCIHNCEPILGLLDLKPKSWFHQIPSIFYYQVVRTSNGVKT